MKHELRAYPDPAAVARAGAELVAERARTVVAGGRRFTFAVSGGHTPWDMFADLVTLDVPWSQVTIFQVDERVAPAGDPDRNLTHLRHALGDGAATAAEIVPMPVEDDDLEQAASRYGRGLPESFALVHLGLGPDGHTASLVPDDPVLEVADRAVALTATYQGRRRMTLTYPALARAQEIVWLVTGADKAVPLAKLRDGDRSIPAGRVEAGRSVIVADQEALG